MAGYEDTKQKIISTLMGRPVGTEIQPENHQDYALNMLDYIRSLELIATSTLIGVAESNTTPVQPNSSRVCYIAGVAQNQTVVFENFIDENGNPISVTTGDMEGVFIILLWNTQYWSAQTFSTNIISQSESATFYYRYNIRKTYSSVTAMNADVANPIGTDGKYIKVGDIVTVVNSTTPSENGIYSYEGATDGWKYQSSFNFQLEQIRSQNTNTAPSSKLFDDESNKNECYNVTNRIPLSVGQYYDLASAIAAVPVANRKLGLKLTYMSALYEKDTLTIISAPNSASNIVITLNGVSVSIALDSAVDTTPTLVATKIKAATFTGWTLSGTGATVIFTKNVIGVCSAPVYDAGTTGSVGSFVRTVMGTTESIVETQFNGNSISSWTTATNWRKIATAADIAQIETNLNLIHVEDSEHIFNFSTYFNIVNKGVIALDVADYGSVGSTNGWYLTDYLAILADSVEYLGGADANSYGIAFYDVNKNPIKPNPFSFDYRSSSISKILPVPSGAFYFRASGKSGAYVKYITKSSGLLDDLEQRVDNIDQSILNITSNSQIPDVYGIEIANTYPPKLLKSAPTFLSIIKNWGFIGDSYSSGEFEYIDSDGVTVKYMDWYDYSFGQFLMRINGTIGYNYSIGGMTAKAWCTTPGERTWNNGTGKILELKNAYVIQLGSNDTNTDILVGNLSTDVDINDYTNNSDTFAGWICGVIQRIKSINPKAIFFIATVRYTSESSKRLEFSALIREIPSILSNVYVIDIEKYGLKWLDKDAVSKFRSGTHPSAAGHYYQALVYNTLIDWEIRKNLNNFTQIQFVGTDYYR